MLWWDDRAVAAAWVVIGPSGAGKSTLLASYLPDHPELELVRTHTTRPMRLDETDTHVFVTEAEFGRTRFLGTANVFGARYGLAPWTTTRTAVVMLRAFAVEQFLGLFGAARVLQVQAPVPVLVERLRARGDADRAVAAALQAEIDVGLTWADVVVDTSGPVAQSLARLDEALRG